LYIRLESKLQEIEATHKFSRWSEESAEYLKMKHEHHVETIEQLLVTMRSAVVQRQYLLELKAKYAGKLIIILMHIPIYHKILNVYRWSKNCQEVVYPNWKSQ